VKLQTLDVAVNKIKKIENIEHLVELEEFWANNNEIEDWNDVYVLETCTKLGTVYLEKNPIQIKFQEQYRRRIMAVLPNLKQIDATYTRSGL
jgi:protein phosphatase 1 regulatory subunit 7